MFWPFKKHLSINNYNKIVLKGKYKVEDPDFKGGEFQNLILWRRRNEKVKESKGEEILLSEKCTISISLLSQKANPHFLRKMFSFQA